MFSAFGSSERSPVFTPKRLPKDALSNVNSTWLYERFFLPSLYALRRKTGGRVTDRQFFPVRAFSPRWTSSRRGPRARIRRNGAVGRVRGRAVGARGVSARARGSARARVDGGTLHVRSSRRVARYASRDARGGARAPEPRDVPLSGRDAPNFVRLALGLRALDESVGVRGDHGARYERGRVLHDRGSRRGALGRPRARLADGRHGVTGGAEGGIRCPGIRRERARGVRRAFACVSLERAT